MRIFYLKEDQDDIAFSKEFVYIYRGGELRYCTPIHGGCSVLSYGSISEMESLVKRGDAREIPLEEFVLMREYPILMGQLESDYK